MSKCLLLVIVFVVCGAALADLPNPNDKPGKFPPYVWAPLPPELAPEAKLPGGLTVTLKQFLPHPGTSFGFRRPSGFIPARCAKLYSLKSPRVLDCWLEENATVANVITWDGSRWSLWTDDRKEELRAAFQTARNWRAGGFGAWPGPAFDEPPVNREAPFLSDTELRTVLDSTEARQRYLAQIAVMLASEIDAWVPWSVRDYTPEVLGELFRSDLNQYLRDTDDGTATDSVYHGHLVAGGVTPAHVVTMYRFLIARGIIGATPVETIARLLEWCRDHMRHYYDLGVPVRTQYEAFWHYSGFPPVARVMEGTVVADPTWPATPPASWTAGCTGTTRFLRALLRVVNVPVREIVRPETGGHAVPFFAGEGLYLSHGDDPYSQDFTSGGFTGRDLLLNSDQWMRWFPPGAMGENVGRRTIDLNLERPSPYVINLYCRDQRNGLSRADGTLLHYAEHYYTLAQLESFGFYDDVASLAETSADSDCVAWR